MAGILLGSGQTWVVDAMATEIASLGGLYVGLMTNSSTPSEGAQIGGGITELSPAPAGSGYERQLSASPWGVTSGTDPTLSGASVQFTVSGTWDDVNGYFVSIDGSGNNALWAEVFSVDKQGTKYNSDRVTVTPIYEQQHHNES